MNNRDSQIQRQITKTLVLLNFENFVNYFFPLAYNTKFIWGAHHFVMAKYIDDIIRQDINTDHIVVNIAPRYTKTEFWSILFPCFGFAHNPNSNFINTSFSQMRVEENSSYVQNLIMLPEYQQLFPKTKIKKGESSKRKWHNDAGGGFLAVPSGGQITGFGAGQTNSKFFSGAVINDDPIKPEDARHENIRKEINNWYTRTLVSRRNNSIECKVPIITVMQRVHEEDLSGYILQNQFFRAKHIYFPVLDTKRDKALWEFKHTVKDLRQIEQTDRQTFATQYQQKPAPESGNIFQDKYWQYFSFARNQIPFENKVIVVDTSEGETQNSDYSVFQVWAKHLNRAYLLDMIRVRADSEEQKDLFSALWKKWRPRTAYIEKASTGTGLVNFCKKQGFPVHGIRQHKSKEERANRIIEYVRTGFIYLNQDLDGLSDYLTEHRNFPNAKNDDMVDGTTLAIDVLLAGEGFMIYPEFSTEQNVNTKIYNPNLPLFVSFNTINQPAYIFAQYCPNGQIVVLDSGVSPDTKKEQIVQEAQNKQLLNYPGSQNNYRICAFRVKTGDREINPFDWDSFLYSAYGMSVSGYEIFDQQNDIIDIAGKFLIEQVINTVTGQRESRIVIHPRNELLINALSGGVTYEIEEKTGNIKPFKRIRQNYPFSNLVNAFHQFVYEVAIARKVNNQANKRTNINLKAVYN